ncbi:MAG: DUF2330 domain-containing protein [Myxococcota bacterium]
MTHRILLGAGTTVLTALVLLVSPDAAFACGGFFCSTAPIDQAGENIVYSVESDGSITTHVQILYQGEAQDFAWILPVPAEPEVSVGTDALFIGLRNQTQPRFQVDDFQVEGTCRADPVCEFDSVLRSSRGPGDFNSAAPDPSAPNAEADDGVEVHFEGAVGPYNVATLSSGSSAALYEWLTENGYDIPDVSVPLLEDYVIKGDYFVALKLQQDRGVGEIQPVVLRYREEKPCLPIRLTSIAATPDMPITAYVLASERAVPLNYMRVNLNLNEPALYGYSNGLNGSLFYSMLASQAIDDAGGQGFITEYAGPIPDLGIQIPDLTEVELFSARSPTAALEALQRSGLNRDPLMLPILLQHIPPPPQHADDPMNFYNCLARGGSCGADSVQFDGEALVAAIEEQILAPRREVVAMLGRHSKLTRLFTTMDPEEMTVDPLFDTVEGMAEVSNVHGATEIIECSPEFLRHDAPRSLVFPNGERVRVREGTPSTMTDEAYCRSVGGTARDAGFRGGGLDCSAGTPSRVGSAGGALAALGLLLPLALFLRRRHR